MIHRSRLPVRLVRLSASPCEVLRKACSGVLVLNVDFCSMNMLRINLQLLTKKSAHRRVSLAEEHLINKLLKVPSQPDQSHGRIQTANACWSIHMMEQVSASTPTPPSSQSKRVGVHIAYKSCSEARKISVHPRGQHPEH